jgi:hypothetical protein
VHRDLIWVASILVEIVAVEPARKFVTMRLCGIEAPARRKKWRLGATLRDPPP